MESPFNFNDSLIKNKCDYGHVQIEQFNIGQDYELWFGALMGLIVYFFE